VGTAILTQQLSVFLSLFSTLLTEIFVVYQIKVVCVLQENNRSMLEVYQIKKRKK